MLHTHVNSYPEVDTSHDKQPGDRKVTLNSCTPRDLRPDLWTTSPPTPPNTSHVLGRPSAPRCRPEGDGFAGAQVFPQPLLGVAHVEEGGGMAEGGVTCPFLSACQAAADADGKALRPDC
jgi:hypothetical protein